MSRRDANDTADTYTPTHDFPADDIPGTTSTLRIRHPDPSAMSAAAGRHGDGGVSYRGALVAAVLVATVLIGLLAAEVAGEADATHQRRLPIGRAVHPLPARLADGHWQLRAIKADRRTRLMAATSQDMAIAAAQRFAGSLADGADSVSARLVSFTDTHAATIEPDGSRSLDFVDVPAWYVRFLGAPQPIYGGLGTAHDDPATELDVVVDARDGSYVEMFSYQ